jgi:ATP/maltotriose-dependent transcriptional regulator MalT
MFTLIYYYVDKKNSITATGSVRGDTHSKAKAAYNDLLKKDRRLCKLCNDAEWTYTHCLRTTQLSAQPPHVVSDMVIPACIAMNLSKREIDVMLLLRQGKSNKEMQQALSIGEDGVKTHLKKIYHKLTVHSGKQAVAKMEDKAAAMRNPAPPQK